MNGWIVVAPVFDDVTPYSYDWSREVLGWLKDKGYEVEDISGRVVSRAEVERAIRDHPDANFYFADHGSESALWGSADEAVIDLTNCQILSGKEVVTMACLAAKSLGVKIWQLKGKVFLGYYEVFSFTTDALAEFKKFANSWLWYRLQGISYKDALEATKKLGYDLSTMLSQSGKYMASVLMRQNTDALRCYNGEVPPTSCLARALALKVFGRKGWFISRLRGLSILLAGIGIGLYVHDRIVEWSMLGSCLHGMDVGVVCLVLALMIEFKDFLKLIKKS